MWPKKECEDRLAELGDAKVRMMHENGMFSDRLARTHHNHVVVRSNRTCATKRKKEG
jgi:hypothetical protein